MLLDAGPSASLLDIGNLVNKAHPLADGLVAWWLVVPPVAGAGVRLLDWVGTHPGTLTNMSATPSGTSGWGRSTLRPGGLGELRFDGTNDVISCGDADVFSFTDGTNDLPFTLCCWVWMTAISTTQAFMGKLGALNSLQEWLFFDVGGSLDFRVWDASSTTRLGRSAVMTQALYELKWIHLAASYDGSKAESGMRIYRNGVQLATGSSGVGSYVGMTAGSAAVKVGAYRTNPVGFLNGKMDDVRIYRRALSQAEILGIYKNSVAGYPGLLNRLPLFPVTGPSAGVMGDEGAVWYMSVEIA